MDNMNHNLDLSCVLAFIKMHPIFSFAAGILTMIASQSSNIYSLQIPTIMMQVGQWIAWLFIYCTGAITILGFLEKTFGFKTKFNWFKRKKK